MLRRAFVLLFGTLALVGCAGGYGGGYGGRPLGPVPLPLGGASTGGPTGQKVVILLPLSGPRADIGQAMLHAAQLALDGPGSPPLDVKDTTGNPQAAAAAAQAAIAEGAGLILGPLTSGETAAVAPVARAANVAMLAFTNDPSQAQPGVWTLGITPGQQVRRLVAATQAQGKTQYAALLPENDFGHAMGQALIQATTSASAAPPNVRYYGSGMSAINAATRDVSGYASRRGPIDAKMRAARLEGTPEGRHEAQELAKSAIPPAPFNTLLLADTGDPLSEIASLLPYYDIDRSSVQIIGPALWAQPSSGASQFRGAWYAATDPAARANFEQTYTSKYGSAPPAIADLAYDAASIARVLAGRGYSAGALTQGSGFIGADGWFALLADGQVRRALAVFAVDRGGPQMVEPAPQSGSVPGA
ncbi:MAG TPA: penicillin-binding protein activator [Acetobacteraceae bacterium]|nr:penicillin-binding protein activator [Acetobacteraceae bacterium]